MSPEDITLQGYYIASIAKFIQIDSDDENGITTIIK